MRVLIIGGTGLISTAITIRFRLLRVSVELLLGLMHGTVFTIKMNLQFTAKLLRNGNVSVHKERFFGESDRTEV